MNLCKVFITKRGSFESAHHLNNYKGKCSCIHGHSYKVEVTLSGFVNRDISDFDNATEAMVCDFSYLNKVIQDKIIDRYDHKDLNLFFNQPTAEIMVVHFFELIKDRFKSSDVIVESVKLWETENSYAEYRGDIE